MSIHHVSVNGKTLKLITEFVYPPIPDRSCDWSCVDNNYDGAPDAHSLIAFGRTEADAIEEYLNLLEERE